MHTRWWRIRELWRRVTRRRYTRALEIELDRLQSECARLRQENRALLNSILGIAGIPPIPVASPESTSADGHPAGALGAPFSRAEAQAETPRTSPSAQSGLDAPASGPASPSAATISESKIGGPTPDRNLAQVAAPLRRRSWHQINRALEFAAARKQSREEMQQPRDASVSRVAKNA